MGPLKLRLIPSDIHHTRQSVDMRDRTLGRYDKYTLQVEILLNNEVISVVALTKELFEVWNADI